MCNTCGLQAVKKTSDPQKKYDKPAFAAAFGLAWRFGGKIWISNIHDHMKT